jgi:DNA-binding transcriptional LysR family regulator
MDGPFKPITKVNLKLVQGFILVAEHSSFRQAAMLIGLSQSAVSAQIKRLEEQLGVTLFHRTTRRVELTKEGEELLSCARRAIGEVEAGLRRIQEAADLKKGRIVFACSPTIALRMLAPILARFEKRYPGIDVHVQEATAARILDSVRQRDVDFGVGPVLDAPDLQFDLLLNDPLVALVPKNFPIDGDDVALAKLADWSLLLLDRSTALRASVEQIAVRQGLTINTRYQFTQAQTLVSMAQHGLGIAILPMVSLPDPIPKSLRALRIVDPPLSRQLALITLKGQSLSPAASQLVPLFRP